VKISSGQQRGVSECGVSGSSSSSSSMLSASIDGRPRSWQPGTNDRGKLSDATIKGIVSRLMGVLQIATEDKSEIEVAAGAAAMAIAAVEESSASNDEQQLNQRVAPIFAGSANMREGWEYSDASLCDGVLDATSAVGVLPTSMPTVPPTETPTTPSIPPSVPSSRAILNASLSNSINHSGFNSQNISRNGSRVLMTTDGAQAISVHSSSTDCATATASRATHQASFEAVQTFCGTSFERAACTTSPSAFISGTVDCNSAAICACPFASTLPGYESWAIYAGSNVVLCGGGYGSGFFYKEPSDSATSFGVGDIICATNISARVARLPARVAPEAGSNVSIEVEGASREDGIAKDADGTGNTPESSSNGVESHGHTKGAVELLAAVGGVTSSHPHGILLLPTPHRLESCASVCAADRECRAWTLIDPGFVHPAVLAAAATSHLSLQGLNSASNASLLHRLSLCLPLSTYLSTTPQVGSSFGRRCARYYDGMEGPAERDQHRWQALPKWTYPDAFPPPPTHAQAVRQLAGWLAKRLEWLDSTDLLLLPPQHGYNHSSSSGSGSTGNSSIQSHGNSSTQSHDLGFLRFDSIQLKGLLWRKQTPTGVGFVLLVGLLVLRAVFLGVWGKNDDAAPRAVSRSTRTQIELSALASREAGPDSRAWV
jgi:hypothetical protein